MPLIDAHAHFPGDDSEAVRLLAELDLMVLNISIGLDDAGRWRSDAEWGTAVYEKLAREFPQRYAWCTSFDAPRLEDSEYAERVIAELEEDFARGAVACKVWKNVGMEVRDAKGGLLMVDDPLLEPIFAHLEKAGRPLIMHIAEPKACWQPLAEIEDSPHHAYYAGNPQWHMYGKPHVPSHEELMNARDRVIERHPKLRVVGAHLASLEYDLREVGLRLDRYPNLAVDTAARLHDLAMQDRAVIESFFERFQTRILFGTDVELPRALSSMPAADARQRLTSVKSQYARELAYYRTSQRLRFGAREVQGIALPEPMARCFFQANAQSWLDLAPGV